MRKLTKSIALLLASLYAVSGLAGCAGSPQNNTTTAQSTQDTTQGATQEERLYPDLPEKDYEGYTFNILTRFVTGWETEWTHIDIFTEAENGEVINDATYARNRAIEEKYNVKINEITQDVVNGSFQNTLKKTVLSGDNAFDIALPRPVDSYNNLLDGYFMNLLEVPYLELDKPWWNQQANDVLELNGSLYYTMSDLTIMDDQSVAAMIFNKQMLADFNLDNPYTLVEDGKWTFDKMFEMMKTPGLSKDLNGDGKMTLDADRYPLITQIDQMWSFYHGAGEMFAVKNEEGYPEIKFGSDRTYSVTQKIMDMMYDSSLALNHHKYEGQKVLENWQIFSEGRGLFMWIRLGAVIGLRASEVDFGILPTPKFDETQDRYYSSVNQHTSTCVVIPKSNPDVERTAIILEALTAESRYTVLPAYLEKSLIGKYKRDDESEGMIKLILDTTVVDIGLYYDFGGFSSAYAELARKDSRDIASLYEKSETKMQKDIDKFIEKFENIGA